MRTCGCQSKTADFWGGNKEERNSKREREGQDWVPYALEMSMKPRRVEGCGAFPWARSGPVGGYWPGGPWACLGSGCAVGSATQRSSGARLRAPGPKEPTMPGFLGATLTKSHCRAEWPPRRTDPVLNALFQATGSKHGLVPLLLPSPGLTLEVPTAVTCRLSREPAGHRQWSPSNFSPAYAGLQIWSAVQLVMGEAPDKSLEFWLLHQTSY